MPAAALQAEVVSVKRWVTCVFQIFLNVVVVSIPTDYGEVLCSLADKLTSLV